jgi:hypothetical protein
MPDRTENNPMPCPFCGGVERILELSPSFRVRCLACQASGPPSDRPLEALRLWSDQVRSFRRSGLVDVETDDSGVNTPM